MAPPTAVKLGRLSSIVCTDARWLEEEGRPLEASISQISQRADVVEDRNFCVIVYRSFCRWGWRARRPFPEFEVA